MILMIFVTSPMCAATVRSNEYFRIHVALLRCRLRDFSGFCGSTVPHEFFFDVKSLQEVQKSSRSSLKKFIAGTN